MSKLKWLLPTYLFLAPIIVALTQISILDFPTENPFFMGMNYSPWPQVIYSPMLTGVVLAGLGISVTFVLADKRYKQLSFIVRLLCLILLVVLFIIVFWFGINMSQRTVIGEYLSAINANGLHFLMFFSLPIIPEVFLVDGYLPFFVTLIMDIIGVIGIISHSIFLFLQKDEIASTEERRLAMT